MKVLNIKIVSCVKCVFIRPFRLRGEDRCRYLCVEPEDQERVLPNSMVERGLISDYCKLKDA